MANSQPPDNDFFARLTEVTLSNLTNPQFGVSMLAKEMGMGRHNLYRKVNSKLKITVSQFINQVRLKKAKEILRHTSDTVSDVAYKVGYNNVSYFIRCFHNYYGYSPGQVGRREDEENEITQARAKKKRLTVILFFTIILFVATAIIFFKPFPFYQNRLEKSIAILSVENLEIADVNEIENILQNVRSNLEKFEEITKVTPYQSVLQFNGTVDPSPAISESLNANYLVRPGIDIIDNKTILSLDLSEGPNDKFWKHLLTKSIRTVMQNFLLK